MTIDKSKARLGSDHQPFPAVEMGPIIGKGSFGYVCKGMLGLQMVAVKVT